MIKHYLSLALLPLIAMIASSFTPVKEFPERLSLCKAVTHISKAFDEGKADELLGEKSDMDGVTLYDSKIDIEGLMDEFITVGETETVFYATYSNTSAAGLKAQFEKLRKQLENCLKKSYDTEKLEGSETAHFRFSEKVGVEVTIYYDDKEIDLNIDVAND